jgi:hypothetical protein
MNSFANILPSKELTPFLPWYLMLIIASVVSDLILNNPEIIRRSSQILLTEVSCIISGAIIGSIFYIFGYPKLPITFEEALSYTFQ